MVYVAKGLWRGELNYARYMLDSNLRDEKLIPLLCWLCTVTGNEGADTGIYGRRLHDFVDAGTRAQYLQTFAGAEIEDNWRALFEGIALVREIGGGLASRLGYNYPEQTDANVTAFIEKIRAMPRGAGGR